MEENRGFFKFEHKQHFHNVVIYLLTSKEMHLEHALCFDFCKLFFAAIFVSSPLKPTCPGMKAFSV